MNFIQLNLFEDLLFASRWSWLNHALSGQVCNHIVLMCLTKVKVRFILLLMMCVKCTGATYLTLTLHMQQMKFIWVEVNQTFDKKKSPIGVGKWTKAK